LGERRTTWSGRNDDDSRNKHKIDNDYNKSSDIMKIVTALRRDINTNLDATWDPIRNSCFASVEHESIHMAKSQYEIASYEKATQIDGTQGSWIRCGRLIREPLTAI
jgi:hypothetical protein